MIGSILVPIDTVIRTVARWYRRRATRRALLALSDRTLKDIGIARCDISRAADEADRKRTSPRDGKKLDVHVE